MSSEPTAGDKRKRRVPDAGGFHTDEDGLEASSNLHTRPRRLLQDDLDVAMLEEEIAPFMSFPSLREILAGNSETKGPSQSVCLTKPEQDALMIQPLEPEEFFEFLHNVGHNRLSAKNAQQAADNRTRSIQAIASVGSAFTMWEPRKRHIPSDEELIANLARCAAPRSDEELIANLARCAAPTGVRLAAITAGECESLSESESESDGKDVCLGGDRADNLSGPLSNADDNKVRQELRQKLLNRTRDDGQRAA
jgi:hypothetical protein